MQSYSQHECNKYSSFYVVHFVGKKQTLDCLADFTILPHMQPMHFETALENILVKDTRYDGEAYTFLKEALDFTVSNESTQKLANSKHVSAKELLTGFRELALKQYGPMASTLFNEWGISSCDDVGNMVFNLIEEGMFGKQDSDSPDDFKPYYSFHDAFVEPFLPKGTENPTGK